MHVTYCPECNAEYRLSAAHIAIAAGKTASCKKCRARFVVVVREIPDALPAEAQIETAKTEEVAAEVGAHAPVHAQQEQPAAPVSSISETKTTRRTKAEIRHEHIQQIRANFKALHARLAEINSQQESSEEDVRRWVIDALRHGLGYEDRDIRTEERANDRRVDITVRALADAHPTIVFEVKAIRRPLNQRVIDQAASYASVLNAPYAVITNGDAWIFLRSSFSKEKRHKLIEVFNIALLDEDGVSDDDAKSLYLLTKKAISTGFTEKACHQTAAVQPSRIWKALLEESTIARLRKTICAQYEEESGVKIDLDTDHLLAHLEAMVIPEEL